MKLDKIKTVTIFGDSITKGIVTNPDSRPTAIKDSAVEIVAKHYGLDIKNISFFGQTLKRLADRGLIESNLSKINSQNPEENIVLLAIGGNDCDRYWKDISTSPQEKHYPKTKLQEFIEILESTVDKIKNYNCKPILCTTPPINAERYFHNVICKIADGDEILKYLNGQISNISRAQDCYNIAVIKTAMKKNAMLIDVRSSLLYNLKFDDFLCYDGIHPNVEGQKLIADTFIYNLNTYLN